jgi:hypothetical protein
MSESRLNVLELWLGRIYRPLTAGPPLRLMDPNRHPFAALASDIAEQLLLSERTAPKRPRALSPILALKGWNNHLQRVLELRWHLQLSQQLIEQLPLASPLRSLHENLDQSPWSRRTR